MLWLQPEAVATVRAPLFLPLPTSCKAIPLRNDYTVGDVDYEYFISNISIHRLKLPSSDKHDLLYNNFADTAMFQLQNHILSKLTQLIAPFLSKLADIHADIDDFPLRVNSHSYPIINCHLGTS